jgi:hypothetical protein
MTVQNRANDLATSDPEFILNQVNRQLVSVEMLRNASLAVAGLPSATVNNDAIIRAVFNAVSEDISEDDVEKEDIVMVCAAVDARVRAYFRTLQSPRAILFSVQPSLWLTDEALSIVATSKLYWRGNRYVFNERTFCARLLSIVPHAGSS